MSIHGKYKVDRSIKRWMTRLVAKGYKSLARDWQNNTPSNSPIDPSVKLENTEENITADKEMYQRLVTKLIYLSITRSSDVAFVVSLINSLCTNQQTFM